MHDNVRTCRIGHPDEGLADVSFMTEAVQMRMPSLSKLDMYLFPHPEYIDPLLTLFDHLPDLTHLTIPAFTDIHRALTCFGRSTTLKTLNLYYYSTPGPGGKEAIAETGIRLQGNIFVALEALLMFVISYTAICPFLSSHSLTNLAALHIRTLKVEKAEACRLFFQSFPSFAPNLVELSLRYSNFDDIRDEFRLDPSIDDFIPFDNFRGILGCTKLAYFRMHHPYPLRISDSDIEEMASAWPQLKILVLGNKPLVQARFIRKPTLLALLELKEPCLELEEVWLVHGH